MLSITPFSSSSNVHQMYLSGVNLALNDIQNGNVAVVIFSVSQGRYHYIFGLKETKQNITCIKVRVASFIEVLEFFSD